MMDVPVLVAEACTPSREVLRNPSGQPYGSIQRQAVGCWLIARTPSGKIVGIFDGRNTRSPSGYVISKGDVLSGLLLLEHLKAEGER